MCDKFNWYVTLKTFKSLDHVPFLKKTFAHETGVGFIS